MLRNKVTGFCYYITAKEAMRYINFEYRTKLFHDYTKNNQTTESGSINYIPEALKVKVAKDWQGKLKEEGSKIEQMEVTSDWTYTTPYKVSSIYIGKHNQLYSAARELGAPF
jgi:wobble nucleotide-excising tRNase